MFALNTHQSILITIVFTFWHKQKHTSLKQNCYAAR